MKTYLFPIVVAAGLLAGCNKSVESASQDFNALPTAVQKTIRSQAPNAEIAGISRTSQNGVDAYKVEFREEGQNSQMIVGLDGTVISSDLPQKQNGVINDVKKALTPTGAVGTKFSALPEKVQTTIRAKAPNAEIADVSRHESNGLVIYQIEFRDQGKNPTMRVAEDGTLVQDLQK